MIVSVVIPNWNGEHLLEENLPHILAMEVDEVIVVDDGSTDNSLKVLEKFKSNKKLRIIKQAKNLGFSKSVNRGFRETEADIVLMINTDAKPKAQLLNAVLPHFKDKDVFGVSFSEEKWTWSKGFWRNGFVEHGPGERIKEPHITFWVSGGSGAFRKSIWDKLGGLDDIYYPFYWEDTDISYRALKRGYKLIWEPKAEIIHKHEGTIGKYFSKDYISSIQERNQLIFIWKNITSPNMFKEHIRGLIKRIIKGPGYIKVILAVLSKLEEIKKSRAIERKEATVADEKIFSEFN